MFTNKQTVCLVMKMKDTHATVETHTYSTCICLYTALQYGMYIDYYFYVVATQFVLKSFLCKTILIQFSVADKNN